ncbi:MAG TPA: isoprenylcysteine carboxylmethyltransferase family protein [Gemmatimonadaceae bacterium]|nr:isoprenylcysteine carboxylmethyltransferase family protein [Gemmatimonadaceae bacterium]
MSAEPPRDIAGVVAPPPLIVLAAIALGLLLHWLHPLALRPASWRPLLGVLVALTGLVLIGLALATLRRARTPVEPWKPTRAIVHAGPYRASRNPIYLGFALVHLGVALAVNSLWLLVTLALAIVVLTWGVIRREERYLERRFGKEYTEYKARVRRWI